MDCSWNSPGHNIGVQSLSYCRGTPQPRDRAQISHIASGFLIPSPVDLPDPGIWDLLHCRWILYQLSYHGSLNRQKKSKKIIWFIVAQRRVAWPWLVALMFQFCNFEAFWLLRFWLAQVRSYHMRTTSVWWPPFLINFTPCNPASTLLFTKALIPHLLNRDNNKIIWKSCYEN